jgi:4-hydroxy-tetrahydrodipicolinate synthase
VFAEFKANGVTPKLAELQGKIDAVRKVIQAHQMISLMKRVAAEFSGQSEWSTVRPPLVKMNEVTAQTVLVELKTLGFDMPNFSKV